MKGSGTKLWSAHLHASWLQADPHALLSLSITTTVVIKKENIYIYIPLARYCPIPIWAVLGYTGFLFICLWMGTWFWVALCLVYFLICMDIFFTKNQKSLQRKWRGWSPMKQWKGKASTISSSERTLYLTLQEDLLLYFVFNMMDIWLLR